MKSFLSQLLLTEHGVILSAEDLITSLEDSWKSNPHEYQNQIKQLISFFKIYGDEYHHQKEEDILFPAIYMKSEMSGNGIVQELIEQHEYFRDILNTIQLALDVEDYANAEKLLKKYINDLKDHIAIENNELLPMTENLFTNDELEKLYYRSLDKDRMLGLEKKEELVHFIQKFRFNETAQ